VRRPNSERVIAAAVADYFERAHADVYQEVISPIQGDTRRADLVAVDGPIVHIVESKPELSFDLLAQARYWSLLQFGVVWIAVPKLYRRSEARDEAVRVARSFYGFGVFVVDDVAQPICPPQVVAPPVDRSLVDSLRPEQKTYAKAGSPSGGHFTSFKASCEALAKYVADNDGCKIEDAVKSILHHYASNQSAAKALFHWAREGKIAGVHIGWKRRLYNSPRASALSMRRSA
jgi:hypothetical protein